MDGITSQVKKKKTRDMVMSYLQRLGKSLMFPVACMPLCGILMGIGYAVCPAAMQGGEIVNFIDSVGLFLVKAGSALLDNIPILFAIGVGVGMSEDHHGIGGLAALVSWLVMTTLLNPVFAEKVFPIAMSDTVKLSFEKINNPFIGILAGLIGSTCFNRFKNVRLPKWLGFFSGKRCVSIIAGILSTVAAVILFAAWPVLFSGLVFVGEKIRDMGTVGAGIYSTLNRLLIPSGLHHALNNVFWFDTIGLGDMSAFWAGETSSTAGWSVGMYMSGFFPCMMFGTAGAALAIIRTSDPVRRKRVTGMMISAALCSFVCGITEPFEFAFMFASPLLFVLYALLYGIFTVVTVGLGFRAGFSCSGGAIDLVLSSQLPAAQKTWLILPLGAAAFAVFYLVFYFVIKWRKITILGRSGDVPATDEAPPALKGYPELAKAFLDALGGEGNVVRLENCITRLRLELKDASLVDENAILRAGSPGMIRVSDTAVQVVVGTDVQFVADEMRNQIVRARSEKFDLVLLTPVPGTFVPMEEIPDPVFSGGVLGPCCAVMPSSGEIVAPADGKVIQLAETLHSVALECGNYEVLIHAGIDTVKLGGKGFASLVREGDPVKAGQPLLTMDVKAVGDAGLSPAVITVLTNTEDTTAVKFANERELASGMAIMKIREED